MQDRAKLVHDALHHPPCAYSGCGGPMRPRQYESLKTFNRRSTCSEQCRRKFIADRTLDLRLKAETEHPPCVICNAPVRLNPREYLARYKARETCCEQHRLKRVSQLLKGKPIARPHTDRVWAERGEFTGDFSGMNVKTRDDGPARISKPDADMSFTGSSLA